MAASTPVKPLKVLIVEDCHDTASSLSFLVRLWGHDPAVAHAGPEALAHVETNCPDVVLLDIGLPGMDGWEVARRLQADGRGSPPLLIVMSGYCREEDQEASHRAGCHLHLAKPVNPDVLQALLRYQQGGDEA